LKSLQQAGGAYCLVTAHKDHDVRASLRGFEEGDNLRLLRPKEDEAVECMTCDLPLGPKPVVRYPGYALKLTWDVHIGKAMGTLKVNACWHDIVFRHEWGFTERHFLY
jgi:hypothetical protein